MQIGRSPSPWEYSQGEHHSRISLHGAWTKDGGRPGCLTYSELADDKDYEDKPIRLAEKVRRWVVIKLAVMLQHEDSRCPRKAHSKTGDEHSAVASNSALRRRII